MVLMLSASPKGIMDSRLTPKAQAEMEEMFALRDEAIKLLGVVVGEWNSDPMSVQCFDLRTVERAQQVVERLKHFEGLF